MTGPSSTLLVAIVLLASPFLRAADGDTDADCCADLTNLATVLSCRMIQNKDTPKLPDLYYDGLVQ